MNWVAICLILLSVSALVVGQVCLKHATNLASDGITTRSRAAGMFAAGIGAMTLWFFLWLGLLQRLDLSYLYPFEALSAVFVCLAGSVFLRERLTPRLWLGVFLITLGVFLVSASDPALRGQAPTRQGQMR